MSRTLCALIVLLLVASCGGGESPPSNLEDACSILRQRPKYEKAFRAAERKWGVPVPAQMATIYQESRYRADARTPFTYAVGVIPMGRQSSAFGYSQAIDGTWDQYRAETGRRGARRDRIRDAADFMGWYMNKTREKNGVALTDVKNQYLAYHEGHAGFSSGSHNRKSWLLRIADDVEARAYMYNAQLSACGKLR